MITTAAPRHARWPEFQDTGHRVWRCIACGRVAAREVVSESLLDGGTVAVKYRPDDDAATGEVQP